MTKEEFKSKYYDVELKCSTCGKTFRKVFRKDSPKYFVDLYVSGENPNYCDECWENGEMDKLLKKLKKWNT